MGVWGIAFLLAAATQPDVPPILRARCIQCHGAGIQQNGLRLDSVEAVLRGGSSGPAAIPGKSQDSLLIKRVTSDKSDFYMPPSGARLTPKEVAALRAWIDALSPVAVAVSSNATATKSAHWAFQPIRRPSPP